MKNIQEQEQEYIEVACKTLGWDLTELICWQINNDCLQDNYKTIKLLYEEIKWSGK